jgi:glucose/arabinose dehydrogenase
MVGYTSLLIGLISALTYSCGSDKVIDTVLTGTSLPETPFADSSLGIANPTGVAIHPDGRVFVTHLRGEGGGHFFGQILVLQDDDDDGIADRSTVFADSLKTVTGVAFRGDEVYASVYGEVIVLYDTDGDNRVDVTESVARLLPWGTHVNNQLTFGPDGMLYVALGSEHNREEEDKQQRASILRIDPDARNLNLQTTERGIETIARGIRNAFDLTFAPEGHIAAGELFATDNGPDGPAADAYLEEFERTEEYTPNVPEELNHIKAGFHYGHPVYYGTVPAGTDTLGPIAEFIDHGGAQGLAFNTGHSFPGTEDYLFIALYHNAKVLAVRLFEDGDTFGTEVTEVLEFPCAGPSVTAFGIGHKPCVHEHPLDVAFGPDGSLYIAAFGMIWSNDFRTRLHGKIYKISGR